MLRFHASIVLSALAGLLVTTGCDTESELPDELSIERQPDRDDDDDDDDADEEESQYAECDYLGSDRTCGDAGESVQFCAWVLNEDSGEVGKYWGECVEAPECELWSCREDDGALCDLLDGKPQWVADGCAGWNP